jgi:NAD(P)-dependent dehydrogenase (short-subunit alcohol dehydrogenase family)
MGSLDGKVAIVTGGGQGVGRGVALALAGAGASVAVLGRTPETLDAAADEIRARGVRALALRCDVRNGDEIRSCVAAVVAELGKLDILVNNAQMIPLGMLLDTDEALIDDGWTSGPLATLRFMRAAYPHLKGGGCIVNMGSGAAHIAGPPGYALYGGVKAALETYTRAAAVEWGADGIRANVILPLARSAAVDDWERDDPETYRASLAEVPLGRMGDPEHDIGRAVVFLAGPDASYITGTTLPVDGGLRYLR